MPFEQGLIRVDRGQFIDKGNYHFDPRHPDFAGGADPDGLRDSYQAFVECDAAAVAAGCAVVVGPGTYKIGSALTLSAGYDLFDGAILKPAGALTFSAQVRGWGSRAVIFDTSLGGSFATPGGEWFFNANGFAGGALLDMGGMVKNVLAYDVEGDGAEATGGAMTSGSAVLTRSGGTAFVAGDVGKLIKVPGAGASGANLFTTISAFTNSTTVTLAAAASTTVSGKTVVFGSDDTTAIQAVFTAATDGDTIFFPPNIYMTSADLNITVSGTNYLGLGRAARIVSTTLNTNVFEIAAGVSRVNIEGLHLQAGGKEFLTDLDRELGNCIWMASTTGNRSTEIRVRGCKIEDGHSGIVLRYCNYGEITGNHIETAFASWTGYTLWASNHCTCKGNIIVNTNATGGPTGVELDVAEAGADTCDWNQLSDVIDGNWINEGYNISGAHNTVSGATVDVLGSAVQFLNPPGVSLSYIVQKNRVLGSVLRTNNASFRVVGFKDLSAGTFGVNENLVQGCEITQLGTGQGVVAESTCARNVIADCTITAGSGATSDGVIFTGAGNSRNKVINCRITGAGRHGFLGNAVAYPHVESCEIYSNANGATFTSCSNPTYIDNHTHDNATASVAITGSTGFVREWGNVSETETVPSLANTLVSFTANDATPSVRNGRRFRTANTGATTITAFDDSVVGQRIWVQVNDANTTFDLTSTNIKVSGKATDYVAASGDVLEGEFDGTNWRMVLHKQVFVNELNTWTAVQSMQGTATTSGVMTAQVSGEANARGLLFASGTMWVGPGTGAQDASWGRLGTTMIGSGDTHLTRLGTGAYDAGHLVMGAHHVWFGGSGHLRFKDGTPLSATDGVRVPTMAAAHADSVAADVATLVADFNSLLAKLRATFVINT